MSNKVIARIKGGLGNQLFCYAAARRLTLVNKVDLVLDDVTGFVRDTRYRRAYALDNFSIPCRKTTPRERMEPFERARRAVTKWVSRRLPFEKRSYIEQQKSAFDCRLLSLRPRGTVFLDGLWQDERYFTDISTVIRSDLAFHVSPDTENRRIVESMSRCQSIAIHVRWFDKFFTPDKQHNLDIAYYQKAIQAIEERIESPHYFLFSDDVNAALKALNLKTRQVSSIDHNTGDANAVLDLWLMSHCKHFIMANSTFSWWGAWLGRKLDSITLMPPDVPEQSGGWVWDQRRNCFLVPSMEGSKIEYKAL